MSPVRRVRSASMTLAVSSGRCQYSRITCGPCTQISPIVPCGRIAAVVVADRDVGRRQRQADRTVEPGRVETVDRRARRRLRESPGLRQHVARDLLPLLRDRTLHRHAAAQAHAQLAEIETVETRCVQQRVEQRVDAAEEREAMLAQVDHERGEVARIRDQQRVAAKAHEEQRLREREDVIERQGADDRCPGLSSGAAPPASSAGRNHAPSCRMLATRLRCVSTAPLATPVVPPVYCRNAMSS